MVVCFQPMKLFLVKNDQPLRLLHFQIMDHVHTRHEQPVKYKMIQWFFEIMNRELVNFTSKIQSLLVLCHVVLCDDHFFQLRVFRLDNICNSKNTPNNKIAK